MGAEFNKNLFPSPGPSNRDVDNLMDIVYSKNNVPTRLTVERWLHIVENHDDVAGYYDEILRIVEDPDFIMEKTEIEETLKEVFEVISWTVESSPPKCL